MKQILALLLLLAGGCATAAPEPITLEQTVNLALRRSRAMQLARLRVDEASAGVDAAVAQRYPQTAVVGLAGYTPRPYEIKLPSSSLTPLVTAFGAQLGIPSGSSLLSTFPPGDMTLSRGGHELYLAGVGIFQPLSLQWKIETGVVAARAGRTAAEREAAEAASEIRFSVERLYCGILVEDRRHSARAARLEARESRLRDLKNAQGVGETLDDSVLGLQAEVTETQADLLRSSQERARLTLQLADLIGIPGTEQMALAADLPERPGHPIEYWLARVPHNPSRQVAAAQAEQAAAGVRAARQDYIPDVSLFALGYAQDGEELFPRDSALVGVTLKWDVFDFGRKRAEVRRNLARQGSAEANRDRLEEDAAREIRIAYQDVEYAEKLAKLAGQACEYRRRVAEIARQSAEHDLSLPAKALAAEADLQQAEADLFAAEIQLHLSLLKLYWLCGEL